MNSEEELKKLQRKFIPINIITCVLSLVAGFTLLFTPLISIDIGPLISAVLSSEDGSAEAETLNDALGSSDEGEPGEDDMMENLIPVLSKVLASSGGLKISLVPASFGGYAFAEDPLGDMILSLLDKGGMFENLFKTVASSALTLLIALGGDIPEDSDIEKLDLDSLAGFMDKIETDETGARADFLSAVSSTLTSLEIDDTDGEIADMANTAFDQILEMGKPDENTPFSMEYLICHAVESSMGGDGEGGNASVGPINNYEDLADYILSQAMASEGGEEFDTSSLKSGFVAIFFFLSFPAFMWLLLALLSGIHILLKNKTFLTWYVKLTGFFPCLIFGILPLALKSLLSSIDPMIGAAMSGITSMTWISGACFLALAILSIGFLYPRRRKIRTLRRLIKENPAPASAPAAETAAASDESGSDDND